MFKSNAMTSSNIINFLCNYLILATLTKTDLSDLRGIACNVICFVGVGVLLVAEFGRINGGTLGCETSQLSISLLK